MWYNLTFGNIHYKRYVTIPGDISRQWKIGLNFILGSESIIRQLDNVFYRLRNTNPDRDESQKQRYISLHIRGTGRKISKIYENEQNLPFSPNKLRNFSPACGKTGSNVKGTSLLMDFDKYNSQKFCKKKKIISGKINSIIS